MLLLLIILPLLPRIFGTFQCPDGWIYSSLVSNKCYFFSTSKMTWQAAESYCQRAMNPVNQAHLTSISSAFENTHLAAIVANTSSDCDSIWVGGRDTSSNGHFSWTDGSPFTYENWAPGQPGPSYPCVSVVNFVSNLQWKTQPDRLPSCFICEAHLPAGPPKADCYQWRMSGATASGVYSISPDGSESGAFDVFCDMETDGGGWTVFQKRINDTVNFWNRTWSEYKNGFDNGLTNNAWLGLDRINLLSTKGVTLRIDVWGNRCQNYTGPIFARGIDFCGASTDPNGYWFGEWNFRISSESDNYRMSMSSAIRGNLTSYVYPATYDSFYSASDNQTFTTVDRNTQLSPLNCAASHNNGAWWYTRDSCSLAHLNGIYDPPYDIWGLSGFAWLYDEYHGTHFVINPVRSEMKLR